jgi:hypothetical protein
MCSIVLRSTESGLGTGAVMGSDFRRRRFSRGGDLDHPSIDGLLGQVNLKEPGNCIAF